MKRKRTILFTICAIILVLGILFIDPLHTCYSAATDSPRSWIKSSSPMKKHLSYVWENWEEPDLKSSDAVRELSSIIKAELPPNSSEEKIRKHIKKHYQKPNFATTGAQPATQWRQLSHGYTAILLDDYKLLKIRYFSRNGHFLYADIYMDRPKGSDLRQINLTPPVNLWKQAETARIKGYTVKKDTKLEDAILELNRRIATEHPGRSDYLITYIADTRLSHKKTPQNDLSGLGSIPYPLKIHRDIQMKNNPKILNIVEQIAIPRLCHYRVHDGHITIYGWQHDEFEQ